MKILQVIHDFLPKHQAGAELYCYHVSQELKRLGHDVRLFYSEIDHDRPAYSVRRGEYDGLPFWEIVNNHGYASFEETYGNPRVEKAFAECLDEFRPDAVHYHHLLGLSFGCIRLCKERSVPTVFTLHDYWLTCPRGGGQRFRGEGDVCHSVNNSLCAECVSRYSFGASKGVRAVKKILSWFERTGDETVMTAMLKGKIVTPKRSFVSRGVCDIEGDVRNVVFAHPPAQIHLKCDVEENAELLFAVAMPPGVYDEDGDGVRFTIRCGDNLLYERFLHPKERTEDRGWRNERISLNDFAGKRCELVFQTEAHPTGEIDFCSACWAEPKIVSPNRNSYRPSVQSRFQSFVQKQAARLQQKPLVAKVERRAKATRSLFDDVDLFVAPSRFLRSKFIEYGLDENKIVFSDYGIFNRGYLPKTKKSELPLRFTYIGTLVSHKGLHVSIEAFNQLPKDCAALNVYGNTGEFTDYVNRIKAAISHPGISLCGRAENSDIPHILSETDALIVSSIWFENSPITIHEAFLAGVPVITSNFGGMACLVRDGENGLLFEMGNPDSLYQCLKRCVDEPSLLDRIRPHPQEVKTLEEDARWLERTYQHLLQQ